MNCLEMSSVFLEKKCLSLQDVWCNSSLPLHRDLMSWINGIRGLVSSEELAKDVTGAEALLERHQV